jgi:hypothetical protein
VNRGLGPLGSAPADAVYEPNGSFSSETWFFWKGSANNDLYEAHTSRDGMRGPYNLHLGPIGSQP